MAVHVKGFAKCLEVDAAKLATTSETLKNVYSSSDRCCLYLHRFGEGDTVESKYVLFHLNKTFSRFHFVFYCLKDS